MALSGQQKPHAGRSSHQRHHRQHDQHNPTQRVAPSGLNFTLTGEGNEGIIEWGDYYDFSPPAAQATGGDQAISVTAEDPLPSKIKIHTPSIEWRFQIPNSPVDISLGTGQHTVYVTYGTPTGSDATLQRVSTVCAWANDKSTPEGIADAIGTMATSGSLFNPNYSIFSAEPYRIDPIWECCITGADCISLATLMDSALKMIGHPGGQPGYVLARHTTWTGVWSTSQSYEYNALSYKLGLMFGPGSNPAYWNNYEGCCLVHNKYWMGGFGSSEDDAKDVLYECVDPNESDDKHQA